MPEMLNDTLTDNPFSPSTSALLLTLTDFIVAIFEVVCVLPDWDMFILFSKLPDLIVK